MSLNRATYVEARNIEVKFELAKIGAEIEKKIPYSQNCSLKGEWDVLGEDNSRIKYLIRKDRAVRSSPSYILTEY